MNLTPIEFIEAIKKGKTEFQLNRNESDYYDESEFRKLVKKYGHTAEEAKTHLQTDYTNGFTICKNCGSYYHLGKGFTKHISNGCLHCEGKEKHNVYFVNASPKDEGGFHARYMSVMFDDKMSYCYDKLIVEKFRKLFND
jgi:hypothetical protein